MLDRGRRPKRSPAARDSRGARISRAVRSALPTSRPGAKSATSDKARKAKQQDSGAFAAYARRVARRNAVREAHEAGRRWTTRRAVILLLVAGAMLLTLVMPMRTYFAQLGEAKRLEAEHAQLLRDIDEMARRQAQQDDPGFIRAEAKRRLGFVMPGERAYKVHFPDDPEPEPIAGAGPAQSEGPWYVDMWGKIAVKTVEAPPRMNLPIVPVEPAQGGG